MDRTNLDLSVVMPSYLEEENLRLILPRLHTVLEQLKIHYEILVIDTKEPMDHTEAVCKEHNARYVRRVPSNTFGSAVRTGIEFAQGQHVLFMDADGSHTPEFIPDLYKNINKADVIIASRYINGGVTENSASLKLMSRVLNLTYAWVLGLKCKDVSNSFKIYKRSQLQELELKCENFDIIEEILFKLKVLNKGFSVLEVPFTFKERMFGETKRNLVAFIITYVFTLIKLRFAPVRKRSSVR